MAGWMIFLIVITAVAGGLFLEYRKNEKKQSSISSHHENEINELRKLIQQLKKRIENLEAIAAAEPDEFQASGKSYQKIEVDDAKENEDKISEMARKKMEKS